MGTVNTVVDYELKKKNIPKDAKVARKFLRSRPIYEFPRIMMLRTQFGCLVKFLFPLE